MDFFISPAHAQAGGAAGPGMGDFLFIIVLFAVFWFVLIRPQQKRAKEHRAMIEALAKGDEVVTQGGMLGRITKIGDNFVDLEVSDGVEVHVQRTAIGALMPKGTIKAL